MCQSTQRVQIEYKATTCSKFYMFVEPLFRPVELHILMPVAWKIVKYKVLMKVLDT